MNIDQFDFEKAWIEIQESLVNRVCADYEAGLNGPQIANKYSIAVSTVSNYLKKKNIKTRNYSANTEEIYNLYLEVKNKAEVSRRLGLNPSTVSKHLKKRGL